MYENTLVDACMPLRAYDRQDLGVVSIILSLIILCLLDLIPQTVLFPLVLNDVTLSTVTS